MTVMRSILIIALCTALPTSYAFQRSRLRAEASKTIRKWKPEKVVSDGSATINEPVSFPLFGSGSDREFFVVNAAIGTPPQFFNLTLDTFTGGVVVYTRDPVVPPAQNEQR
ncbi:hypothetical protein AAVH_33426, partial [Aphelenchoides avenae]